MGVLRIRPAQVTLGDRRYATISGVATQCYYYNSDWCGHIPPPPTPYQNVVSVSSTLPLAYWKKGGSDGVFCGGSPGTPNCDWKTGTDERCSTLLRFAAPINPGADGCELWLDDLSAYANAFPRESIGYPFGGDVTPYPAVAGALTATVRYRLCSEDWDPVAVQYNTMPTGAVDDPSITLSFSVAANESERYDGHAQKFEPSDAAMDRDYYGIICEVTVLTGPYLVDHPCGALCAGVNMIEMVGMGPTDPTQASECCGFYGVCTYFNYYWTFDPTFQCECTYHEPASYIMGFVDGDGFSHCLFAITADHCIDGYQTGYWYASGEATPRLWTGADFQSVDVISRSRAANVATLTTATPHGLRKISGTCQQIAAVQGVSKWSEVSVVSSSITANVCTINTATAHNCVTGNIVRVTDCRTQVSTTGAAVTSAPTPTSLKYAVSTVTLASAAEGGTARNMSDYDAATYVTDIPSTTSLKLTNNGQAEGTTACGGRILFQ